MIVMRKELVFVDMDKIKIFAERLDRITILIAKAKANSRGLSDSDRTFAEDKNGYRYRRNIPLETVTKSEHFIFQQI